MLSIYSRKPGRLLMAFVIACGACLTMPKTSQALSGTIYDSRILQRIKFTPSQRTKVRKILRQSQQEMRVIFRKYGINPRAKPVFSKLQSASGELQAVRARQKREMKKILSREQYKSYLAILQETAARVIKATRKKP